MSIMDRILSVYHRNYPLEERDLVWNNCMKNAAITELNEVNLENMCQTTLTSGFGGGPGEKEILKFAQGIGISGITNPENNKFCNRYIPSCVNIEHLSIDEMLDKIQGALEFPINMPPFTGNNFQATFTKHGVISNRHVYNLWLLIRIMELEPDRKAGIIEIGAGFGTLGYFLSKAGYQDYTTIDLALVNACQTYYLSKNLPERNILISGDAENPFDLKWRESIKLLHSTDFASVPKNRFSIMINMDGLTEYGIEHAKKYIQSDCAPKLLSVNHEVNSYRVCDVAQGYCKRLYRYPFWLRDGYVEELYQHTN